MIIYRIENKITKLGAYRGITCYTRMANGHIEEPFAFHNAPQIHTSQEGWKFGWKSNEKFFEMFNRRSIPELKEDRMYFVAYFVEEFQVLEDGQVIYNPDKAERCSRYISPNSNINEIKLLKRFKNERVYILWLL